LKVVQETHSCPEACLFGTHQFPLIPKFVIEEVTRVILADSSQPDYLNSSLLSQFVAFVTLILMFKVAHTENEQPTVSCEYNKTNIQHYRSGHIRFLLKLRPADN
jgi:hypothetical protein